MLANHEIALIVAVAMPVVMLIALNLFLFVRGERGTLLMPHLGRFPVIVLDAEPESETAAEIPGIAVVEEEPLRKAA